MVAISNKYDGAALLVSAPGLKTKHIYPGESFTIGRSPGNDLILPNPTVSRKHAVIKWEDKFPRIVDCNSTGGVEIDGEFVKYRHLQSTHIITLGNEQLLFEYCNNISETPTAVQSASFAIKPLAVVENLDEDNQVMLFTETQKTEAKGFCKNNEQLQKFLVSLETTKRTGTCMLTCDSTECNLIFGGGKIKQAHCGSMIPLQALQYICSLPNACYVFSPIVDLGDNPLDISPQLYMAKLQKNATLRRSRKMYVGDFRKK